MRIPLPVPFYEQSLLQLLMPRIIKLLYFLFPLVFVGCNSDIFVEPVEDIVDSISLSGDNGTASFKIQRDGLESVEFDNNVDYDAYATFFDSNGEILDSKPEIANVSKILYNSHSFAIEFNIVGDKIEVVALDNANSREIEVKALFSYGYVAKPVVIHIGQGRPLEINYLVIDTGNPMIKIVEKIGRRRYTNNSDHPLRVKLYPLRDVKSTIDMQPDEMWSDGVAGAVPVPAYMNGEWNFSGPDEVKVAIGSETQFCSSASPDTEATIEIPAYSSAEMYIYMTFASLGTKYLANIKLPNSQLSWTTAGKWRQLQPIGYDIKLIIEE